MDACVSRARVCTVMCFRSFLHYFQFSQLMHRDEGYDDMPAHVKSSLLSSHVSGLSDRDCFDACFAISRWF